MSADNHTAANSPRQPIARLAGVCGWPVHHSLSPFLHGLWLAALREQGTDIHGAYTMFAVHPMEANRAFRSLKQTSISGVNVTIPLKSQAFAAADEQTPEAIKLGVCNVLYKRGDILVGHNTDMEGFAEPLLKQIGPHQLMNMSVTLVGTGGAARAALGALLSLGAPEIRLIGRDDEKVRALVARINTPNLFAWSWADRDEIVAGSGLVINATSAGMKTNPALDIDISTMRPGSWVYDLVYTPIQTPLLKAAEAAGLNTISGLDMLIAQARPSFKLFFGHEAPFIPELRDRLSARLEAGL